MTICVRLPDARGRTLTRFPASASPGLLSGLRASVGATAASVRDLGGAPVAVKWPTAKGTLTLTHPSGFDVAGGIGAREVTVRGLTVDADGVHRIRSWAITLGASSPTVDTTYPGQVLFVHSLIVTGAGSYGANAGDIQADIGAVSTGSVTVLATTGRSRNAQFWVPDTHDLVFTGDGYLSIGNKAAFIALRWRGFSAEHLASKTYTTPLVWRSFGIDGLFSPGEFTSVGALRGIAIPAGSHLDLVASAPTDVADVSASLAYVLVPKGVSRL